MMVTCAEVEPDYQPRHCASCGKRIPRWVNGRQARANQRFCSTNCGAFDRRQKGRKSPGGSPAKVVARNRDLRPISSAFPEPVLPTEGKPEYAACKACGLRHRKTDGYCSVRCREYVPVPPRKFDGEWFMVAGPVDYCAGCGMAIGPRKPHGFITPWRNARAGLLYCSREGAYGLPCAPDLSPLKLSDFERVHAGHFRKRRAVREDAAA